MIAPAFAANDGRLLRQFRGLKIAGYEVRAVATHPCPIGNMQGSEVVGRPLRLPFTRGLPSRIGLALTFRQQTAALVDALAAWKPDIVLTSEPESLAAAVRLKKLCGSCVVYDAHEFYEDEFGGEPERNAWVVRAHAQAAPFLDGFITVNGAIAKLYAENVPDFPLATIVHNAVDWPVEDYDGRLHLAADLAPSEKILLFQGGMQCGRGLHELIEAAEGMPHGWTTVLLGDGPLSNVLKAMAGPRVRILPAAPYDELPAWTAGAAVGAILYEPTSLNQRFATPNKLWEYPAAGAAVISARLFEVERLTAGYDFVGWVENPSSPPSIIDAVRSLGARLSTARLAARAFSASQSWAPEMQRLTSVLNALLRDHSRVLT